MSDNTILPERHYLDAHIPVHDWVVSYAYGAKPIYRLVFRLDMLNISKLSIRLLGRKWTIVDAKGNVHIVEADHVFGQDPMLPPSGVFAYGGRQDFEQVPVSMELRFFGIDQMLTPFITRPIYLPKHPSLLKKRT